MGGTLSSCFQSGHALLSSGHNRQVSEQTRRHIRIVFDALRADPKKTVQRLDGLLSAIPRSDNILQVHNEEGYNLLQKCVGINNVELVRWCLTRNIDINRGACSLPLHIACIKGYEDVVSVLLKHGARVDVEARMCWPGPHHPNCEERTKSNRNVASETNNGVVNAVQPFFHRSSEKMQNAMFYAIDGDQVDVLELLSQHGDDHWSPWQQRRPLLHIACERGSWNCVRFLATERADEINQCYDEYYPIHQAVLHDYCFLDLLIQCGAETTVRTSVQQMTALHVVLLMARKSAQDTLASIKLLMDNGLRDLVNEGDSLGNTALHTLIVRYALEEQRYGYPTNTQPWNRWDMLHIMRYLLQNGAKGSINLRHNSALACVLRHIRDWEFRYDLLQMLLEAGGDPNERGRDGSVPLMVCLVPLINKDPLHHLTHTMKVCYLNCVRILLRYGADPNCTSRSSLTPLQVLVFAASENVALADGPEKAGAFEFVCNLLTVLLQQGLDPNVRFNERFSHLLLALVDLVNHVRAPADLSLVYDLTLIALQFGADPNARVDDKGDDYHRRRHKAYLPSFVLVHYVQLLMAKERLLQEDHEQRFAALIRLYAMAMGHSQLFECLRVLHTQTGLAPLHSNLCSVIRELCGRPRSLKQMARIVVHHVLHRKPALAVSKLPLPPSLKDYLLHFDHR